MYSCSDIDITGITDYDPETPPTPIKATIVPIVNESFIQRQPESFASSLELTSSSSHFNTPENQSNCEDFVMNCLKLIEQTLTCLLII